MDNEACEKLYEANYMRVFSYAVTLCGDRSQAEEIAQETFYRAFSRLGSFRGESDEFTWLCAIAANLFRDEKRRQSRTEAFPRSSRVKAWRFMAVGARRAASVPARNHSGASPRTLVTSSAVLDFRSFPSSAP